MTMTFLLTMVLGKLGLTGLLRQISKEDTMLHTANSNNLTYEQGIWSKIR